MPSARLLKTVRPHVLGLFALALPLAWLMASLSLLLGPLHLHRDGQEHEYPHGHAHRHEHGPRLLPALFSLPGLATPGARATADAQETVPRISRHHHAPADTSVIALGPDGGAESLDFAQSLAWAALAFSLLPSAECCLPAADLGSGGWPHTSSLRWASHQPGLPERPPRA